ncbi:kinesin-like protein KIF25 isoform X2 [Pantherophis guttatus]|uniref:Kinesin-like protein KIF25 isoform X2 n=1 Tax=Pantherophis guttatus TaxID=94885 RepID=A0A6P9CM45_PANGU|nr:kinesin-like protein KIF25 isoform X2 [Pantherophis guttatus]
MVRLQTRKPGSAVSSSFVSEQQIRQLERKLRTKEERIIVLETENALLHLKLAKNQGIIGNSSAEHNFAYYNNTKKFHGTAKSIAIQLHRAIQRLKQDMQNLRLSALQFSREIHHQGESFLHQVLLTAQELQLQKETMETFQIKTLALEQSLHEINERYMKEKRRRKVLHNSLLELRGNIRVHCRIRPFLPFDAAPEESAMEDRQRSVSENVICATDDETILVKCSRPGHALINKTYQFERVYSTYDSQVTVFADISPLLTSLLDGFNVCIMAYGQTGSGKTYTMLGPQLENSFRFSVEDETELGIIPRASKEVFRLLSEKSAGSHWVEVSVVEVYNNEIFDLLAKDNSGRLNGIKRGIMTNKEGKNDIPLLTNEPVEDVVEFLELVNQGLQLRAKHSTLVHTDSSRSHLVITLTITIKVASEDDFAPSWTGDHSSQKLDKEHFFTSACSSRACSPAQLTRESVERRKQMRTKLQLVDLAGSESVGISGVTGSLLRETSFINRSLSALADVLGALSEQNSHIPYRNSKLTHLLQDAIGGDAKLLVVLCVSPSQKYITESLQTLGFGSRARQVQRGHAKKRNELALNKSK